jgi:hypothetical protein
MKFGEGYKTLSGIDWLIDYCFMSRSRIFHLYEDVTIAGVTRYFEPGWKLTWGVTFQRWKLRQEVWNLDPSPLRIEPRRGILIINPVQNSTALKHVISTPMFYSIKIWSSFRVLPLRLLFVYFAFDSLCHKIPKSFDRSFPQQWLVFQIAEN